MGEYDADAVPDKEWAVKYILDPLTCPEPSQECGPGTSFRSCQPQRTLSVQSRKPPRTQNILPTPPSSASPTRSSFYQTFAPTPASPPTENSENSKLRQELPEEEPHQRPPLLRRALGRSFSVNSGRGASRPCTTRVSRDRSSTIHTANPPETDWNRGTILSRTSSISASHARRDRHIPMAPSSADVKDAADAANGLRRSGSLSARYQGDMSHRPLAMLKKDHRAADRAPHLHRPHKKQPSDIIDSLDSTGLGAVYHHEGPYDAASASRNTDIFHSPISAVYDSNMEALKATPREYVQDSLVKHVPLQGTAVIPPGMRDMSGRVMDYEEGADLMREPDAPGGAYKRYDFIPYRDDDLKGKGEPSFTLEKELKERKARFRSHNGSRDADQMGYEMLPTSDREPGVNRAQTRQRSVSNVGESPSHPRPGDGFSDNGDIRRSHSTGKKLAEGLRRRFGSLRRKERFEM